MICYCCLGATLLMSGDVLIMFGDTCVYVICFGDIGCVDVTYMLSDLSG